MVHRDIRMVGKGCTRMVQTRGARPGVSLLSAKRRKAIGKSWNSYRRDVLYAKSKLDGNSMFKKNDIVIAKDDHPGKRSLRVKLGL